MGTVTGPPPPRSDEDLDAQALEALIEEARRRARRRRLGYAVSALAVVAAGLLGFNFFDGGGGTRSSDGGEARPAEAAVSPQVTDSEWRAARGLEGGSITAFAVDPQHPNTVFAATWEAGVFKSADGGRRWHHLDLGSEVSRVDALAIAPGEPKTVYAGTGRGVLTTTNGGRSWQATGAGILGKETAEQHEHRGIEGYVSSLAVDPRDADVAYAGTWEKGLFKTEDGGRSWRRIGPNTLRVNTLSFQPGSSGVVYAGGRGVHRSRDGGATWHPAGLRGEYVTALALDPKHPQTIYAGTMVDHFRAGTVSGDIFKTTDGGASWRRSRRDRQPVSAVAVHPHDTNVVYAETWAPQVLKTANGGRTWHSLDSGGSSSALALDPRDPETIYVGTGDNVDKGAGVAKSVDGGRSWRPMNAGLTAARVSALAVAPGGRAEAYAAVLGRGVFERVGGRWRATKTSDRLYTAVAVDPRDPANVYAATDEGVFRSANGGASWSASSMTEPLGGWPAGGRLSALAVDPKNSKNVYAIAVNDGTRTGGGVTGIYESLALKSMDGGRTWPTLTSVQSVVVPATQIGFIPDNVHRSPLAIDPRDPHVLYAGGAGVVKSSDGGLTWRRSGLGRTPVLGLAVDPSEAGVIYAATDAGAFKSTDAGATWLPLRGALDGARVKALAIDPEHHRTVFAGTDGGVLWSTDGGRRWHRFTHLPHRPFPTLAVDRSAGLLYAGADGGGIFELKLAR
jgi:photosystem II stability/assembly factor-like uncharacterized protein